MELSHLNEEQLNLIRQTLPSQIAHDICSVQPMDPELLKNLAKALDECGGIKMSCNSFGVCEER